ncbi:hypothetical protein [Acidisphaera sp. L21]|uniref:hypothetical protein n=1 Tax=Acidisphaera sp. L21 TaxID=1641851 RepID=UPI00131D3A07|nr:hypothetical protein [Acidisphaera sp. L21]
MKYLLFAGTAALGFAAVGAHAQDGQNAYPTPITRPIYSSVPQLDVGGGGPWSKTMIVTGNGGYTTGGTAQGMPSEPNAPAAAPAFVQQGQVTGSHG